MSDSTRWANDLADFLRENKLVRPPTAKIGGRTEAPGAPTPPFSGWADDLISRYRGWNTSTIMVDYLRNWFLDAEPWSNIAMYFMFDSMPEGHQFWRDACDTDGNAAALEALCYAFLLATGEDMRGMRKEAWPAPTPKP